MECRQIKNPAVKGILMVSDHLMISKNQVIGGGHQVMNLGVKLQVTKMKKKQAKARIANWPKLKSNNVYLRKEKCR